MKTYFTHKNVNVKTTTPDRGAPSGKTVFSPGMNPRTGYLVENLRSGDGEESYLGGVRFRVLRSHPCSPWALQPRGDYRLNEIRGTLEACCPAVKVSRAPFLQQQSMSMKKAAPEVRDPTNSPQRRHVTMRSPLDAEIRLFSVFHHRVRTMSKLATGAFNHNLAQRYRCPAALVSRASASLALQRDRLDRNRRMRQSSPSKHLRLLVISSPFFELSLRRPKGLRRPKAAPEPRGSCAFGELLWEESSRSLSSPPFPPKKGHDVLLFAPTTKESHEQSQQRAYEGLLQLRVLRGHG